MPTPCNIAIEGKTQGNITAGAFTAESVGNIYVQGHCSAQLNQDTFLKEFCSYSIGDRSPLAV
ncbi:type VI secretion system Hcp family effector [Providencia alcalifaciens]|nr:type VI secretion system Hcp family effector [Providencia alcalifaciens]